MQDHFIFVDAYESMKKSRVLLEKNRRFFNDILVLIAFVACVYV